MSVSDLQKESYHAEATVWKNVIAKCKVQTQQLLNNPCYCRILLKETTPSVFLSKFNNASPLAAKVSARSDTVIAES
jgi:hypothetical protein